MEVLESGAKRTGGLLAAARTTAGLELTDIARETRVPLRHLRALETDSHDDLPALPYAIGFVKAYARAVGLDAETVAAQFRSETTKSAHIPTSLSLEPLDERRLPSRTMVAISLGLIVVLIAGLSAWGRGAFDPAPPTAPVLAQAPVAATAPAEAIAPQAAAPIIDPATGAVVPAGVAPGFAPGFAPAPTAAAAAVPATGAVVLTAREDVWIKVYDRATRSNARIGILKAGEAYAVPDQPGLALRTGKAGALAVTVGGRPIPPLGGPVETINDVSLAAADLAARANGIAAAANGVAAAAGPRPIATIPAPTPVPPVP